MDITKSVTRLAKRVLELLPSVGLVPAFGAVLIMMSIIFIGVFARYALDKPLPFVDEYSGYLLASITMLGLAYALKTRGHISVDIAVRMLPPRVIPYLEIATLLVALAFVTLLLFTTTKLTITSLVTGRLAWGSMETPLGLVQLVMPIGLGLFVIGLIAVIVSKIRAFWVTKEKAQPTINVGKEDFE